MDKALEDRLRKAISDCPYPWEDYITIRIVDAKRLLYRLKKENSKGNELEYRKPCADSKRK